MGTLNTSSALSEERGGTLELHIALFHCVLGSGLKQVVRVVAVTIQEKGGGGGVRTKWLMQLWPFE